MLKILLTLALLFFVTGCKSNPVDKTETAVKVAIVGAIMLPFAATGLIGSLFSDESKGECRIELGQNLDQIISTFGSPEYVVEFESENFFDGRIYAFNKRVQFHDRRINQYKGNRIERIFCRLSDESSEFYTVEYEGEVAEIYISKARLTKKYPGVL